MNIHLPMFWVYFVDALGSLAMLIFACGIFTKAYSLRHRSFIHLYLFLVALSLAAFSVSRAVGHLLKRILITLGYSHAWKILSPFSGGINSIIFVVIATSSFLYVLFRSMQEERDLQHQAHMQEIQKARDFLQSIIDSLNAQLLVIDSEYNIRMVNKKLRDDYNVTEEKIIGKKCHSLIHCGLENSGEAIRIEDGKTERQVCPWSEIMKEKKPVLLVHKQKNQDGQERIMEIMASPVFDEKGGIKYMIETLKDITEKVLLEQKLMEKEKLEGVIEMAGTVAHELNTPLFVILGNAQLLQSDFEEDDPVYEELQGIIDQVKKVTELTKKMATITHYEAKEYVGDVKYIDIEKAASND